MTTENLIVSEILQEMAKLAYEATLYKRKNYSRNSLLMPVNKIFDELRRQPQIPDIETFRAKINTEIFEYLTRITTDRKYKPGKNKRLQIENFVSLFFDKIFYKIYRGKLPSLMKDQKVIKGAYLFYLRNQFSQKQEQEES
jgi:CRISPR-associated protein Csc3